MMLAGEKCLADCLRFAPTPILFVKGYDSCFTGFCVPIDDTLGWCMDKGAN